MDLGKTQVVADLFAKPREQRDDAWVAQFFAVAPEAAFQILDPQIRLGPDGFPYFQLAIPADGEVNCCALVQALDHCLDNGLGAVICNSPSETEEPGWVFSYAQLFSYSLFRDFMGDPAAAPPAETPEPADTSRQILVMQPSESFLPLRVRRAMTEFFRKVVGVEHPKMLMVVEPGQHPANGLMFNLSLQDFSGDEERFRRVLQALHWYLPTSYCAILRKPEDWGEESFQPLSPD